jgi:hypothetical protein
MCGDESLAVVGVHASNGMDDSGTLGYYEPSQMGSSLQRSF